MESWSDVVTSYPEVPEPKDYAKAIRSATIILAEDLAPFETEWLVQTLLFKPVGLFETIYYRRTNEGWLKTISDSFKILSTLVEKCWDDVETYYRNIIEVCMLPFDPQTQKDALLCMNSVAKYPSIDLSEEMVSRHINALEEAKTCKAPRAMLVGTICQYHPEIIQEEITRIWRIYLNMLQQANKTDQVATAVLQGVYGLFEHFGEELELEQLNAFYVKLRECFKMRKCREVVLLIIKDHAYLFIELLRKDRAIRTCLWKIDTKLAMDAICKIYELILDHPNGKRVLNCEVLCKLNSPSMLIKQTALRIIVQAHSNAGITISNIGSGIELEFLMRAKKLSYEEAKTVSYSLCIDTRSSDTMLFSAIMFYDNLPNLTRKDIVVDGIFNVRNVNRKAAVDLLVEICVQDNRDKYIDVWRAILDNTSGMSKAVVIFEEALDHILEILAVATWAEKPYEVIKPVISLMATLLSMHKTEFTTDNWCQSIRPTLVHLAKLYGVDAVKMVGETADDEIIYAEEFEEDTVLNKLLSHLSATENVSHDGSLSAYQIIFSNDDTDFIVLSKALSKLEVMIENENCHLDKRQLSMIINHIYKLKSKNISVTKDARIFQRDATVFLGKYRHMTQQENFSEDIYVLKLKNKVTLNIPNIIEGNTFKIDLQRVLQLCLIWGDTEALYSMLAILSASLCDRTDPGLQEATVRVIHALFRTNIRRNETEVAVYPALLMCNTAACVQVLMKGITEEPTPTVRRRLSDSLQILLSHNPGSKTTGELLKIVGEQTVFLISGDESAALAPGLDIIRAFLSAITDNNSLIVAHLPNILTYTTNIQNGAVEIFDLSSNLFIDKLDLFTETQIKDVIQKILERYSTNIATEESYLNKIMGLTKRVMDIKKFEVSLLVDIVLDMSQNLTIKSPQFLNLVTLLAYLNTAIELNSETRRKVVVYMNGMVLEQLLKIRIDDEDVNVNAALVFLKEYAEELIEVDAEKTLQCFGNIIENIPPSLVLPLKNNLISCFTIYKSNQNYLPTIQLSYEKWYKKLELQQITEFIEDKILFSEFSEKYSDIIHAVKFLSETIGIPASSAKDWTNLVIQNSTDLELRWGRIFLTDLLSVSGNALTDSEFEEIFESHAEFIKSYVHVYYKRLICKPFVLQSYSCALLVNIVQCLADNYKEENYQNVLDLVEHLWPSFLETTFDDKLQVLLQLQRLPKDVDLNHPAMMWGVAELDTPWTRQRIELIRALPAAEGLSSAYRTFASYLPVRLSELQGNYIDQFRALLDTLATNGDMTLLDIVITLAGGEDTKGWWDHVIDACMASLAAKGDINIFDKAYQKAKSGANLTVCNRIFLPLLKHSSRKFCESYIATIVTDLFNILRVGFKEVTNSEACRKKILSYAIAFNILKVAFDKMTAEALENGIINESAGSQKPCFFLEQTCKYCVTVSGIVKCPSNASEELKDTCLWLQSSSYNCLASAICRRKLNKGLAARVFNVNAWAAIVDARVVYPFELQPHAKYRSSKPTKCPVENIATAASYTGTVRSRMFLTTLSENPLQYDMITDEVQDEEEEDDFSPDFEDSVLNGHGCLSALTRLLEHASTVEHTEWRNAVVTGLTTDITVNIKWFLAQAICNAEDGLKPHASVLCPALLKLIADTPNTGQEKPVLNNLHIDVILTITKWNITELPFDSNINTTVEYLIHTCIAYKEQVGIRKRLLNTLNGLLQLYGKMVTLNWSVFQDYVTDSPKDLVPLLPVFERLLRNRVTIPELLTHIFAKEDQGIWVSNTLLAEVAGLALSLADSDAKTTFLEKFWQTLNRAKSFVTSYVRILFYALKNCKECCDFNQLKIITDLAPKVEKSKCLTIISTYLENSSEFNDYYLDMFQIITLSELFDSELRVEAMKIARNGLKFMDGAMRSDVLKRAEQNCKSSSVKVRKEAFSMFLTAFQAQFKSENHNPYKRKAVDSSPLLNTIDSEIDYEKLVVKKIFVGMFDLDDGISKMMSDGVEECLSKDINMRFAELFYIIVYQCSLATNNNYELSHCCSKLLELLFSDLRSQDAFKAILLRDEGLPPSVLNACEGLSVGTKTAPIMVLRSGVTFRQRTNKAPTGQAREIDVQKPITDILEVFLQLSKTNSQVCQELCVQMMKCLQGTGRRFNLDLNIAKQLFHIIKRNPYCLTPLVIDACRIFVKDVSSIAGFTESVQELKQAVANSAGYLYTNILFEDLQLRSGAREPFIFSMFKEESDAAMRDEEFTLEGLKQAFGALANWDDLRLQDKRQVEASMPPLWANVENFTVSLRQYFDGAEKKLDYGHWFNKMVASYYSEEVTQDKTSWLKQTEKWPKRDFVTAAVIEAIQWHQNDAEPFGSITSNDCLAEWAARLMIRTSYHRYIQQSDTDAASDSFTKDELSWCQQANERNLSVLTLQCIERNKDCRDCRAVVDFDFLPWVQERVRACRSVWIKENNMNSLQKTLSAAEKLTKRYGPQSTFKTNISMQNLILHLYHDLGLISKTKLDNKMEVVSAHIIQQKGQIISSTNANVLISFYETAMLYYDEQWNDNDEITQNALIMDMTEIIDNVLDHNLANDCNLLFSVLLNRLAYHETTMSDDTAKRLLEQIYRIFPRLDFFSIAILKKVLAVLPVNILNDNYLDKLQDSDLNVCKEYFQLICDANYSLLQYVSELRRNVLDETEWNTIFNRMKKRLFETNYGGTDYQSLNTLKNKLYALEDIADFDAKAAELKLIMEELRAKPQRSTLRLSQLCPDLCSAAILDSKRVHLQRLLRLPPDVYVVKFSEQISVFSDSIRRPCLVHALLSNGTTRRYICKSGEPMYRDASVQRVAAILLALNPKLIVRSYNVTPLSDDSAIIEYLEDHVRLRDLMEEKHDINVAVPKGGYEKLILAPSLAMEQYQGMCDKVTPYILRSSIENNCSCVEEFITKKRTFEDTLSSMTILNWLFGVGDRHLQNIMYSERDGGVSSVDWASIFQYGCQELPPARLTANVLAVCDVKVLESRLQSMLLSLRESKKLFQAFLRTSFYWLGPEFKELKHVNNILQGKAVSYEITRECIVESEKKYKNEYVQLLDNVFENFVPKDEYSVEDQVSCLLQHCTEPRILAVTPPGWEAWL